MTHGGLVSLSPLGDYVASIEFRINIGIVSLFLMGRGDFSRPDFGRLKPPLPQTDA